MSRLGSPVLVWLAAVVVGGAGAALVPAATRNRDPGALPAAPSLGRAPGSAAYVDADSLARIAPFRAGRVPARARYRPDEPVADDAPPPEPPPWRVAGVVSSETRLALLEELPGRRSATYLVAVGDAVGPYAVTLVTADSVVVEARGVRWTLHVESPW